MRIVKVSMLGLGVVGSQLLSYLIKEKQKIKREFGVQIEVAQVFVNDEKKKRAIDLTGIHLTENGQQAIEAADIVLECMGGNGMEQTRELLQYSLKLKKGVIISSKKCLAKYGEELTELATRNQIPFCYDAAVGGGIPISRTIAQMGKCEKITKIYGICNATSNYILTQMQEELVPFEEALNSAQKRGIAENDPAEDVDGYDTLNKAIILGGFGFNRWKQDQDTVPSSIRSVSKEEITQADKNGFVIKHIFELTNESNGIRCVVENRKISKKHLLSNVHGTNNMIIIETDESGERAFFGHGAGAKPTACAMFDDLISVL